MVLSFSAVVAFQETGGVQHSLDLLPSMLQILLGTQQHLKQNNKQQHSEALPLLNCLSPIQVSLKCP